MPTPRWWRRVRQPFGIDAPRMAVRSALPWPWRAGLALAVLATIVGMWWWGFDFGQFFGRFRGKELETRVAALEEEAVRLRGDAAVSRARASQLESELAMARGSQATLGRQARDLGSENDQLKEELLFLQKLISDDSKQAGLSIQRLAAERPRDDTVRYSLLVVRGGSPSVEFDGRLVLQALLQPAAAGARAASVTVPDDQPDQTAALALHFKYYQRVEGAFRVPPGSQLKSLTARAYESGQTNPRATRSVTLP